MLQTSSHKVIFLRLFPSEGPKGDGTQREISNTRQRFSYPILAVLPIRFVLATLFMLTALFFSEILQHWGPF